MIEIEPQGKAADEMRSIACEMLQAKNATEIRNRIATLHMNKMNSMRGEYGSSRSQEKLYAV